MAVFITKCPHCGADQMSFPIFGATTPTQAGFNKKKCASVAGECGRCEKPVSAWLSYSKHASLPYNQFALKIPDLLKQTAKLEDMGFELVDVWPKSTPLTRPDKLPASVEKAFMQAEINRSMPDCEEAAATMYRRCLDLGLKDAFPDTKGMLDQKLKALVAAGELPKALGDWAHEVRLIGNDGAHDIEGVTKPDLDDARAFIDTVLKYLFTLPAQISARRPTLPTAD